MYAINMGFTFLLNGEDNHVPDSLSLLLALFIYSSNQDKNNIYSLGSALL